MGKKSTKTNLTNVTSENRDLKTRIIKIKKDDAFRDTTKKLITVAGHKLSCVQPKTILLAK